MSATFQLVLQELYYNMSEIISKIIKIKTPKLPPDTDFIENEIQHQGIEALRWAIVEVEDNVLTLAVSGRKLKKI